MDGLFPTISALLLVLHTAVAGAAPGRRHQPTHQPPRKSPRLELAASAPAVRFSNLSDPACRAELARRSRSIQRVRRKISGIATPVQLVGGFGTVKFQTAPTQSPFGLLDCRLALVLEAFAQLLEPYGVVSVRVDNLYRPRARLPGSRKKSQHAYGLAADITELTLRDGQVLNVLKDWQGTLGAPVCDAEPQDTLPKSAILLRDIVCSTARAGIFHHMLTPNFNRAHANHFHFDIRRGEKHVSVE